MPKEPRTEREEQNGQALGGMRNPRRSLDRVQGARQVGRALHKGCLAKWPGLKLPAKAILRGETPDELDDKLVDKVSVSHPPRPSDAQASPGVLHEGPAIVRPRVGPGEAEREGEGRGQESEQSRHGEARAYARGSAVKSLDALSDPAHCRQTLLSESRASTSVGPVESRLKLWETMSLKANLEPFRLTPEGMYTIMGGLKIGGYRSATQYLDLAKQEHIRLGHCWTEQHALAYKVCARSCKRGLRLLQPRARTRVAVPDILAAALRRWNSDASVEVSVRWVSLPS